MELEKIWLQANHLIKESVGEEVYDRWFLPLNIKMFQNDKRIELCFPNEFFKDWVNGHYSDVIKNVLAVASKGEAIKIDFCVDEKTVKQDRYEANIKNDKKEAGYFLNPKYTFSEFVIGPSNQFAHAASLAVAESPAKAYNPLFIYGGVGLGKTHLMQAIGHYIFNKNRSMRIVYISSEAFTNQLIDAIQHRTTLKFRENYRQADILLIDDIPFIAGKEATQEEFFHTFNVLYDAHRQIVISSDRPPKQIPNITERLISRFEWGLVTDIQPPDVETRIAILRKKAMGADVFVPDDVVSFLANKIKTNIRELEGALIRVVAYAKFKGKPIVLDIVKDILKDMLLEEEAKLTIEGIQEQVAGYFNIQPSNMRERKRNKMVAYPRQIAMYLVRELTDHSFFDIGKAFGGRDHTTVMYAHEKINADIKKDVRKKEIIKTLIKNIRADKGIVDKIE